MWAQNGMTPKSWLLDCGERALWVPKDKHLEWEWGAAFMTTTDSCVLLYPKLWTAVKGMGVTLSEVGESISRVAQKLHESHHLLPPPHGSWLLISPHPNATAAKNRPPSMVQPLLHPHGNQ